MGHVGISVTYMSNNSTIFEMVLFKRTETKEIVRFGPILSDPENQINTTWYCFETIDVIKPSLQRKQQSMMIVACKKSWVFCFQIFLTYKYVYILYYIYMLILVNVCSR